MDPPTGLAVPEWAFTGTNTHKSGPASSFSAFSASEQLPLWTIASRGQWVSVVASTVVLWAVVKYLISHSKPARPPLKLAR